MVSNAGPSSAWEPPESPPRCNWAPQQTPPAWEANGDARPLDSDLSAPMAALNLRPPPIPGFRPVDHLWTKEDADACAETGQYAATSTQGYFRGCCVKLGRRSAVYKALRVADWTVFAAKTATKPRELTREASNLKRCRHGSIIKFVEVCAADGDKAPAILVTEFCVFGSIKLRIESSVHGMIGDEVLRTMDQVSSALGWLHGKSLYHSDVKPSNILIRSLRPFEVALSDFVELKRSKWRYVKFTGTVAFCSPEVAAAGRHKSHKDDVWALGCVLLAMTRLYPEEYTANPVDNCWVLWQQARKLGFQNTSHPLMPLLKGMFAWSPRKRWEMKKTRVVVRLLQRENAELASLFYLGMHADVLGQGALPEPEPEPEEKPPPPRCGSR